MLADAQPNRGKTRKAKLVVANEKNRNKAAKPLPAASLAHGVGYEACDDDPTILQLAAKRFGVDQDHLVLTRNDGCVIVEVCDDTEQE